MDRNQSIGGIRADRPDGCQICNDKLDGFVLTRVHQACLDGLKKGHWADKRGLEQQLAGCQEAAGEYRSSILEYQAVIDGLKHESRRREARIRELEEELEGRLQAKDLIIECVEKRAEKAEEELALAKTTSKRVHFDPTGSGYAECGQCPANRSMVKLTREPDEVTCRACKRGPLWPGGSG